MVIPLSKLDRFVADCIRNVQAGRADAGAQNIQTDDVQLNFTVDVIDDVAEEIPGDSTEQVQPDTKQVSTKKPSTSTDVTVKPRIITEEMQTTKPGAETTTQTFGRRVTTSVSYTS